MSIDAHRILALHHHQLRSHLVAQCLLWVPVLPFHHVDLDDQDQTQARCDLMSAFTPLCITYKNQPWWNHFDTWTISCAISTAFKKPKQNLEFVAICSKYLDPVECMWFCGSLPLCVYSFLPACLPSRIALLISGGRWDSTVFMLMAHWASFCCRYR